MSFLNPSGANVIPNAVILSAKKDSDTGITEVTGHPRIYAKWKADFTNWPSAVSWEALASWFTCNCIHNTNTEDLLPGWYFSEDDVNWGNAGILSTNGTATQKLGKIFPSFTTSKTAAKTAIYFAFGAGLQVAGGAWNIADFQGTLILMLNSKVKVTKIL